VAESFYDGFVRIDVRTANEVYAVRHRRKDAAHERVFPIRLQPFECLAYRFGLTGQVDEQRLLANDRNLSRENSRGTNLRLTWRICSPKPGISLSPTASVASASTSRTQNPAAGRQNEMAPFGIDELLGALLR
jgi:hypothetical protein